MCGNGGRSCPGIGVGLAVGLQSHFIGSMKKVEDHRARSLLFPRCWWGTETCLLKAPTTDKAIIRYQLSSSPSSFRVIYVLSGSPIVFTSTHNKISLSSIGLTARTAWTGLHP